MGEVLGGGGGIKYFNKHKCNQGPLDVTTQILDELISNAFEQVECERERVWQEFEDKDYLMSEYLEESKAFR